MFANNGLKINAAKTEYLTTSQNPVQIAIEQVNIQNVDHFKYLGSTLVCDAQVEKEIDHRVQAGWRSWNSFTGIMYDKKIPTNLKAKVYEAAIRPSITYGAECWSLKESNVKKLQTTEMKMLRGILGVSRREHIRNEEIRRRLNVTPIDIILRSGRLRWFGHVYRRDDSSEIKKALEMRLPGRRRRGRPRKRWREQIREDMKGVGTNEAAAADRANWRRVSRPTPQGTRRQR